MTTVNFTINKNNLFACDNYGKGSATIGPSDMVIPPNSLPAYLSANTTLSQLMSTLGANNVTIDYYVAASGAVSNYAGIDGTTFTLNVNGTTNDSVNIAPVVVARTSSSSGGPITSAWIPFLMKSNKLVSTISSHGTCTAGDCAILFQSLGGWNQAVISLSAQVSVNLAPYCAIHTTQCAQNPVPANGKQNPWYKQRGWQIGIIIAGAIILMIILALIIWGATYATHKTR